MRLDVAAAERALAERVAKPLGMDTTAAADGILRIAVTAMSYAVKGVTTERGLDAGDFALVAYGGAGPLHAVQVAREIGIRTVIVPPAPGRVLGLRHAVLGSALRLCAHLVHAARGCVVRPDRARLSRSRRPGPRGDRRHLGQAAEDHRQARGRHALCRPGARGDGRSAARSVQEAGPAGDQARVRRHARIALRHVGAGRARRDRQPAQHRHRRHAQAAAGEDQARQARARQGGVLRQAAGRISAASSGRRRPTPAPPCWRATGSAAPRWSRSTRRRRCCCPATGSRSTSTEIW